MRNLRSLTARRSFPTRVRLETAARYLRFPLVSGGFARTLPDCTRPYYGPRKRGLPQRGVSLGGRPQVRTGRNILAIASLDPDSCDSRSIWHRKSFPRSEERR